MFSESVLFTLILSQVHPSLSQIPINGGWTSWSNIQANCRNKTESTKLVECGGGIHTRYRSCNNPGPAFGGLPCPGFEEVDVPCNTHPCRLNEIKLWSEWSLCSNDCGRGTRKRTRICGELRSGSGSKTELLYARKCRLNQYEEILEECNTWNVDNCPSPCLTHVCPEFATCIDNSTMEGGKSVECACKLGTVLKDDGESCIVPPGEFDEGQTEKLSRHTRRSIKWISSISCAIVIIIYLAVLIFFLVRRQFSPSRIIHMNIEIALCLGNFIILPGVVDSPSTCTFLSIANHFFFSAAFLFMFLESIYFYSLLAWVVPQNGLLKSYQNVCIGWFTAGLLVLCTMCFEYEEYGGEDHCWLRLDSQISYSVFFPILLLFFLILILIEASGSSAAYASLAKVNEEERTSAEFNKKSLFLIVVLCLSSYTFGFLASFHKSICLSWIFAVTNILCALSVAFLHGLNDPWAMTLLRQRSSKVDAEDGK